MPLILPRFVMLDEIKKIFSIWLVLYCLIINTKQTRLWLVLVKTVLYILLYNYEL